MGKKIVYPKADPKHLCKCECHSPHNTVNHFDGCQCCHTCTCHNHVKYSHLEEHRKSCRPRKDRHKLRE